MKAAIYSRKSKFTGKGESIENQVQFCKDYCTLNGIEELSIYEDEGFSGKNINRPNFKKLLEDARLRKFQVLVCYRLDRISRNIADFSSLMNELEQLGISFVSIREHFDTSTPMGRAMMYITSVFAQLERETIAERIRDNMMELARTGRWLGGKTPTGFKSEQVSYVDHNNKEKKMYKLSFISEEIRIVKILFDEFLSLRSIGKLENYCREHNLKSKNGNFFDKSAIIFILTNPVYMIADKAAYDYCISKEMDIAGVPSEFDGIHGLMVYNKRGIKSNSQMELKNYSEWIVALGMHNGIIESDKWIAVQALIQANSKKPPREGTSNIALLTPYITCERCGSKLKTSYKYKDGNIIQHYYKCKLKESSRGALCSTPNLSGTMADDMVLKEISRLKLDENVILEKYKTLNKKCLAKYNELKNQIENLENEIHEKENFISSLTKQLSRTSSAAVSIYIVKEIENAHSQIENLKEKLNSMPNKSEFIDIYAESYSIFKQQVVNFSNNVDKMSQIEKKHLLESLIKTIEWDGKILKIEYKK